MAANPAVMLVLSSRNAMPFFLTGRIDAGSCVSLFNIRRLVGYRLPFTAMYVLITSYSAAMVRLCSHMDPRGAILLDEAIHTLNRAVRPVSVWSGGQCFVHGSTGGQAPKNKGTFEPLRMVTELISFIYPVFALRRTLHSSQRCLDIWFSPV